MTQADLFDFEAISFMPRQPRHAGERILTDLLALMGGDDPRFDRSSGWLPSAP